MSSTFETSIQWVLLFIFLTTIGGCEISQRNSDQILSKLQLPDGFKAEIFADSVPNARQLAMGDNGIIYAGSREAGNVYAIVDKNEDYKADRVHTIAEDMNMPSGIAYRNGSLYIAAVSTIYRYDSIDENLQNPSDPVIVTDEYPADGHHGWKFIAFGPDNKLYVPVGAPCNICNPDDKIFASITRINPNGTGREIIAEGVRNSVGFDWHPQTDNLWFTDNGRDWLGDNRPPDELNHLSEIGQHFGYPYKHGHDIWDPKFGDKGRTMNREFTDPAQALGPHVAPLGMIFYTGDMFPETYHNQILIAEHGSWNRTEKIGYRITKVTLKDGETTSYEPFIEGWLQDNESVWGRPVDLLQLPDGSVLISDDHSGVIYRISYQNG
ncbi:PQQ-dependent sugar dehydrogenase [Fodinibius sp. AD559]|uniref:PQQ-dependent sugar dehydrogenase n=1 Tax=Fodinibius sp. AD559 TaxID=3424179 RepID=UPI004046ADF8